MGVTANDDGSVKVRFSLTIGPAPLVKAVVVAVKGNIKQPQQQSYILTRETIGKNTVVRQVTDTDTEVTFASGELEPYTEYTFFLACVDKQGWYNNNSVVSLGTSPLVAGRSIQTKDPDKPTFTVKSVRALDTGDLEVKYTLSDAGGSGLRRARILASTSAPTRDAVLSDAMSVDAKGNDTVTLTGLDQWTDYKVYAVAQDTEGWYSNDVPDTLPGSGDSNIPGTAISNNSGRTWDTTLPTVSINSPALDGNNQFSATVKVEAGPSGLYGAALFLRESSGDMSQRDIIDDSGGGERISLSSGEHTVSVQLKEYTHYWMYVAVRDEQGNYDGSAATADGTSFDPVQKPRSVNHVQAIPNGGISYDLTAPMIGPVSIGRPTSNDDGRTVVVGWYGASDRDPKIGSKSGLAEINIVVQRKDNGNWTDEKTIIVTPASSQGNETISDLTAGATVRAVLTAVDNQGNASQVQPTAELALDNTVPTVTPKEASQDDREVKFKFNLSDDITGVASYKWKASTDSNDDARDGTLVTSAGGDVTVTVSKTGLSQYETWYLFLRAYDGAGNESEASKSILTWDMSPPTANQPTVTVNADNTVKVSYSGAANKSPLTKAEFVFTSGSVQTTVTEILNEILNVPDDSSVTSSALDHGNWKVSYTLYDYDNELYVTRRQNSASSAATFTVYALPSITLEHLSSTTSAITVGTISYSADGGGAWIYASTSSGQASENTVKSSGSDITGSSITLFGLQPGKTYHITALAENGTTAQAYATAHYTTAYPDPSIAGGSDVGLLVDVPHTHKVKFDKGVTFNHAASASVRVLVSAIQATPGDPPEPSVDHVTDNDIWQSYNQSTVLSGVGSVWTVSGMEDISTWVHGSFRVYFAAQGMNGNQWFLLSSSTVSQLQFNRPPTIVSGSVRVNVSPHELVFTFTASDPDGNLDSVDIYHTSTATHLVSQSVLDPNFGSATVTYSPGQYTDYLFHAVARDKSTAESSRFDFNVVPRVASGSLIGDVSKLTFWFTVVDLDLNQNLQSADIYQGNAILVQSVSISASTGIKSHSVNMAAGTYPGNTFSVVAWDQGGLESDRFYFPDGVTVTAPNVAPTATAGAISSNAPGAVTFFYSASDPDGKVETIAIYLYDNQLQTVQVNQQSVANHSVTVTGVTPGSYRAGAFTVKAVDDEGAQSAPSQYGSVTVAAEVAPVIDSLTITEYEDGSHAYFKFEYQVSDQNNNLKLVEAATHTGIGSPGDINNYGSLATRTVSGGTASGTITINMTGNNYLSGADYHLQFIVMDHANNSTHLQYYRTRSLPAVVLPHFDVAIRNFTSSSGGAKSFDVELTYNGYDGMIPNPHVVVAIASVSVGNWWSSATTFYHSESTSQHSNAGTGASRGINKFLSVGDLAQPSTVHAEKIDFGSSRVLRLMLTSGPQSDGEVAQLTDVHLNSSGLITNTSTICGGNFGYSSVFQPGNFQGIIDLTAPANSITGDARYGGLSTWAPTVDYITDPISNGGVYNTGVHINPVGGNDTQNALATST